MSEKRREVKGKGEKERYTHLNAEFQRIAGRDKKTFLSDQCKEVEEDNGMGKTRDGMTHRDGMGREVGWGFRMGNTCTPMEDSCQCMAKSTQYCKVISLQLK